MLYEIEITEVKTGKTSQKGGKNKHKPTLITQGVTLEGLE